MLILALSYDIRFSVPSQVPVVALLHVHRVPPARCCAAPGEMHVEPWSPVENYFDSFGNRCARFLAQSDRVAIAQFGLDSRTQASRMP